MSGAHLVRARDLSHRFGVRRTLFDITFDVERGTALGIFGPPSAGKSLLLRALATLIAPSEGRLEIAGIDAVREPEHVRSHVGYVPERAGAYAELRVGEYLAFFAAAYRLDGSSVDRALEQTGLSEARDESVSSLSRDRRPRMHLARALLHDPELLLLDDPIADLDDLEKTAFLGLLEELRQAGKTLVVTSRVLGDLPKKGATIAVLKRGRFVLYGEGVARSRELPPSVPPPREP
ncbi:MAG TPA: ATP-binding cassette domain-containing protein [Polyangiaceae bacterium]